MIFLATFGKMSNTHLDIVPTRKTRNEEEELQQKRALETLALQSFAPQLVIDSAANCGGAFDRAHGIISYLSS